MPEPDGKQRLQGPPCRAARHRTIIRRHSGWLIPFGFATSLMLVCVLFLAWYLRPGPRNGASSVQTAPVALTVSGLALLVPTNHIETAAARRGGAHEAINLFALYPSMRGYSQADAQLFANNGHDSTVLHLLLRSDPHSLGPRERLTRIYQPYIVQPDGAAGPFGLRRYVFQPDSPYARDDLFVAESTPGPLLFLCQQTQPNLPSPNCIASARPLAGNVSFSWRFKRAWLPRWRDMATKVNELMTRFGPP